MSRAYYNENDPFAAQWLRNLIAAGLIAPGDVDERSIVDVRASDLDGYTQCHFFAGIGGWSLALRLAGWSDDRPVWTGSCPCQPYSSAGAGKASNDERHLWPAWFPLIAQRNPPSVFGEQVEAAIGWGWLDVVFADLEGQGYACGATVLPACSVGAPHIRQRVWFVADAARGDQRRHAGDARGETGARGGQARTQDGDPSRSASRLGQPDREQLDGGGRAGPRRRAEPSDSSGVDDASGARQFAAREGSEIKARDEARLRLLGDGRLESHWAGAEYIACRDGKARPAQPGIFPLAHGVSARVGKLRGAGNAIVPQVAAQFIAAYEEARSMAGK